MTITLYILILKIRFLSELEKQLTSYLSRVLLHRSNKIPEVSLSHYENTLLLERMKPL